MDKDKLIEKLKSEHKFLMQHKILSKTLAAKVNLTAGEIDYILTSLTAPVDGKLPELEIAEWPINVDPEGNIEETEWMACLKGTPIMVTAASKEKAIEELMTSIRVALLHNYNSKLTKTHGKI